MGFVKTRVDADGRWWAVGSDGQDLIVTGVDHVKYSGFHSDRLGYAPYGRNNDRIYASRDEWERVALGRIREWGFTSLGTGCDRSLYGRGGFLYNHQLGFGARLCVGSDPDLFIVPSRHAPCTFIPNMFHPGFSAFADAVAREQCAFRKDDPNLFGYFLDNELVWWGKDSARPLATGLFDTVRALPDSHSARQALEGFVKVHGEDKVAFLAFAAETYFRTLAEAVRRHDPNHLVLGTRFAGFNGAHDVVFEACGRYCDVVTVNTYPRADLDRNVVEAWCDGKWNRLYDLLARVRDRSRKPVLITEWSFMALDSGCPCTYATGQRFYTQDERAAAAELFVRTALASPAVIGYSFFAWMDDPAEGTSRNCPENGNYGLVSIRDEPYGKLTERFAHLHAQSSALHRSPPPEETRPAAVASASTAMRFLKSAETAKGMLGYDELGGRIAILSGSGFACGSKVGAGQILSSMMLDGDPCGTFNASVHVKDAEDRNHWLGVDKVEAVRWERSGRVGVLSVVGSHADAKGYRFRLTVRLTFAPWFPGFLAEFVTLENLMDRALPVRDLYFSLTPPKSRRPKPDVGIPNLWKGPNACEWVLEDGMRMAARSWDPSAARINFWVQPKIDHPHGDVLFRTGDAEWGPLEKRAVPVSMGTVVRMKRG